MADQRSSKSTPTDATARDRTRDGTKKGVTPPKGRPTRSRNGYGVNRRAFGPIAQWITLAALLVLVVVVLIMVTGGGDFNPFNDEEQVPTQFGLSARSLFA